MPRKARIDAPGALHHIIFRGIEGWQIFRDNKERLMTGHAAYFNRRHRSRHGKLLQNRLKSILCSGSQSVQRGETL